jgi:hypothetical protein
VAAQEAEIQATAGVELTSKECRIGVGAEARDLSPSWQIPLFTIVAESGRVLVLSPSFVTMDGNRQRRSFCSPT